MFSSKNLKICRTGVLLFFVFFNMISSAYAEKIDLWKNYFLGMKFEDAKKISPPLVYDGRLPGTQIDMYRYNNINIGDCSASVKLYFNKNFLTEVSLEAVNNPQGCIQKWTEALYQKYGKPDFNERYPIRVRLTWNREGKGIAAEAIVLPNGQMTSSVNYTAGYKDPKADL
ncbi:hypothetical protein [Acetobacter persici]|uniref:hypothetical protein n=1 Tax=Acetobacter persici TaxID=1076596 RepID=UPI0039E981C5